MSVFLSLTASYADVVELVDTLASGASGRKAVRVQVSPSVPFFIIGRH